MGYALRKRYIPNPIDIILVAFQKAFPLDYILILSMAFFFIMATMSGLKNLGIWFFVVRVMSAMHDIITTNDIVWSFDW